MLYRRQALTEDRSPKVWVLLSSFAAYTRELYRALQVNALQEREWQLCHRNIEDVIHRQPDSDVIGVIGGFDRPESTAWARQLRVPCINISSFLENPRLPSLWPDNPGIGRSAAAVLSKLGLQHFGYFGFSDAWFSSERQQAFQEALLAQELPCSTRTIASLRLRRTTPLPLGVRRWLLALKRPCGILAVTDGAAVRLIQEIAALGFRVPDDYAVLGVGDDDAICPFCNPPLSSIPLPGQRMGQQASLWLNRLLQGHPWPAAPIRVCAPDPVLRESTQIDAPGDALLAEAMRIVRRNAPRAMLTGHDLAARCGVTRRTLDRHFTSRLKMTPKQAIDQIRAEHMKWLLGKTEMLVKQMWPDMGFSSANHMSRFFRRMTGISPSEYRLKPKS